MTNLFGLQNNVPAPLLFIQAAEKFVHLMVQVPLWLIFRLLAVWALAFVYLKVHWVYPLTSIRFVRSFYNRINLKELIRGVISLRVLIERRIQKRTNDIEAIVIQE